MSDDHVENADGSDSEKSSEGDEGAQRIIKTDLSLLRSNKTVSSRLQIFNQLIEQRERPAIQPRVFKTPVRPFSAGRGNTNNSGTTVSRASPSRSNTNSGISGSSSNQSVTDSPTQTPSPTPTKKPESPAVVDSPTKTQAVEQPAPVRRQFVRNPQAQAAPEPAPPVVDSPTKTPAVEQSSPAPEQPVVKREFKKAAQPLPAPVFDSPTKTQTVIDSPTKTQAVEPPVVKREFKKMAPAATTAPADPTPVEQAPSRRQFKRKAEPTQDTAQDTAASAEDSEASMPKRVFKKKQEVKEARVFKKRAPVLDVPPMLEGEAELPKSPRKRVFKRGGPTLTGLEVGNAAKWENNAPVTDVSKEAEKPKDPAKPETDILDGQRRDFEAQKTFFLKNMEHEKEKLTQAKTILEEISQKLEDEQKQLAKDKAAVHYEREEINILQRELKLQQDIQKEKALSGEEKENYEVQIRSLKEEIEKKTAANEAVSASLNNTQKQIDSMKHQWEKERAELVNSAQSGSSATAANLEIDKRQLEQERTEFQSVSSELRKKVTTMEKEIEALKEALEHEKNEKKKLKGEMQKAQESQMESLQKNKELVQQIAQKEKQSLNVESNVAKALEAIRAQVDNFLLKERAEFKKEKEAWEDTQLRFNSVAQNATLDISAENFEEAKKKLAAEKQKVAIVKRYIGEERQRFIEVKRKFEKEHDEFLKERKEFLLSPPQIVISVENPKAKPTKKPSKRPKSKSGGTGTTTTTATTASTSPKKTPSKSKGRRSSSGGKSDKLGGEPADSDGDEVDDSKGHQSTDTGLAGSDSEEDDLGGMGYTFKGDDDNQPGLANLKETLRVDNKEKGNRSKSRAKLETTATTREETANHLAALVEDDDDESVSGNQNPNSGATLNTPRATDSNSSKTTAQASNNATSTYYDDEDDQGPYYETDETAGDVFAIGEADPLNYSQAELSTKLDIVPLDVQSIITSEHDPNEIAGGTLRGLLLLLGSRDQNDEFSTAFLITFDYFLRATTLLKIIVTLYLSPIVPSIVEPVNAPQETRKQYQRTRLIEIINFWIILRYDVLRGNKKWQTLFESFMKKLGANGGVFAEHATTMLQTWQAIGNQYDLHVERKRSLVIQTPMEMPATLQFLYISATQMAQQLTLREQTFFQQIESTEYYAKGWESGEAAAPNLTIIIERFNEMCYWVATEVIFAVNLNGQPAAEYRAQTISRLIHTMNELRALNNFNSLMQIYTGLHLPMVDHLTETWELVPKADRETMRKIGELMDHRNNYKNYRSSLEVIEEQPCIPFISLLLRDLTFIEDDHTFVDINNSSNSSKSKTINFEKMGLLSRIFERLQDWRSQLYDFEEDASVQAYLNHKIVKTQDELEKIASVIEGGSLEEGVEEDQNY